VNAAPVLCTAADDLDDSVEALESELADRVDFFKILPATNITKLCTNTSLMSNSRKVTHAMQTIIIE
jgi:hypothetical protein